MPKECYTLLPFSGQDSKNKSKVSLFEASLPKKEEEGSAWIEAYNALAKAGLLSKWAICQEQELFF
jgi:hypothetical protein